MARLITLGRGLGLLLVVSLAFNLGFSATYGVRAYQGHCLCKKRAGKTCLKHVHQELKLSDEQVLQMEADMGSLFRRVGELKHELRTETEVLADLMMDLEPDRSAIALQLDKIAELQRRVQQAVVDHLLEGKAILSPEQQELFGRHIRRWIHAHAGGGPGGGPGRHGPEGKPGHHGPRGGRGHGCGVPCREKHDH